MRSSLLHILILLIVLPLCAQEKRQMVSGKIVAETYPVKDILVVNLQAERETRTDTLGIFRIVAKSGDTLLIADTTLHTSRVVVGKTFMSGETIVVERNEAHELEAVVVDKTNITSESLGLVKEGQKTYTPAERKLYTAGDLKPIHLIGIIGGSMQLDPVFNAINGRTKMLKKAVNVEQKETALETLSRMFTDEEVMNEFQIPDTHVKGFLYYCVEDKSCVAALKSGSEEMVKFIMSALAVTYLELLSDEK